MEIQRAILGAVVFLFLLAFLASLIYSDEYQLTPICVSDQQRADAGILADIQNPAPDCRAPYSQFTQLYFWESES